MKININWPKVIGVLGCAAAAASAFIAESDKQKTASTIKNLTERISELENK